MSNSDTKYNGWTNYATWRVNLELFDGFDLTDIWPNRPEVAEVADNLREMAEDAVASDGTVGPALSLALAFMSSLALAFMSDVNWREIASNLIDSYYD